MSARLQCLSFLRECVRLCGPPSSFVSMFAPPLVQAAMEISLSLVFCVRENEKNPPPASADDGDAAEASAFVSNAEDLWAQGDDVVVTEKIVEARFPSKVFQENANDAVSLVTIIWGHPVPKPKNPSSLEEGKIEDCTLAKLVHEELF